MRAACEAVRLASALCASTQDALLRTDATSKSDDSPVTAADFAAQAIVSVILAATCPSIALVAEETADALRADADGARLLARVTHLVNETLRGETGASCACGGGALTANAVADAIDRGAAAPSRRGDVWILGEFSSRRSPCDSVGAVNAVP